MVCHDAWGFGAGEESGEIACGVWVVKVDDVGGVGFAGEGGGEGGADGCAGGSGEFADFDDADAVDLFFAGVPGGGVYEDGCGVFVEAAFGEDVDGRFHAAHYGWVVVFVDVEDVGFFRGGCWGRLLARWGVGWGGHDYLGVGGWGRQCNANCLSC